MAEHGKSRRSCYHYRSHWKVTRCLKSCELYDKDHQCCFNVPPRYWYTDRDWVKNIDVTISPSRAKEEH